MTDDQHQTDDQADDLRRLMDDLAARVYADTPQDPTRGPALDDLALRVRVLLDDLTPPLWFLAPQLAALQRRLREARSLGHVDLDALTRLVQAQTDLVAERRTEVWPPRVGVRLGRLP